MLSLVDRGVPTPLTAPDATITFTISRNDVPPIFFNLTDGVYRATIREDVPIGTSVRLVEARDTPAVSNFQL